MAKKKNSFPTISEKEFIEITGQWKDKPSVSPKKMTVACDDCKVYDENNKDYYYCHVSGSCPGDYKEGSKEREFLYYKKYRKTIEARLGTCYQRPGSFLGKLVHTVIGWKEYTGRFIRRYGDNQLYFFILDQQLPKEIEVNLEDVTYIEGV